MMSNVFVGTSMSDVKFEKNLNYTVEVLEGYKREEHHITIGEIPIGGIKPNNFHPTLEKGEVFILVPQEKILKITAK